MPKKARRPAPPRATRADIEAAEVLRVAGGVCERCETASPALTVVQLDGRPVARCLNPVACRDRLRASLREVGR